MSKKVIFTTSQEILPAIYKLSVGFEAKTTCWLSNTLREGSEGSVTLDWLLRDNDDDDFVHTSLRFISRLIKLTKHVICKIKSISTAKAE